QFRQRRPRLCKGLYSGLCRARPSAPHILVDAPLVCHRAIEGGIFLPCPDDVAEVTLANPALSHTSPTRKSLHHYFVQALMLFASRVAKDAVEIIGNIANGVLHTFIVCSAGNMCNG